MTDYYSCRGGAACKHYLFILKVNCLLNVCTLAVAGSNGSSAGGQPVGRQHHAEDGSTLLLCTLAPLQRQVCSPFAFALHLLHPLRCVFTHVWLSFFPVCSASNTRQKESCALWPGSRCLNPTGGTGGSWGEGMTTLPHDSRMVVHNSTRVKVLYCTHFQVFSFDPRL